MILADDSRRMINRAALFIDGVFAVRKVDGI
jgi:hypothetical protein